MFGVVFVLISPPAAAASQEVLARGKALYEKNCAFCHGIDGRAATPVGQILQPRPRNFADPVAMARLSDDQIYRAIKDGKPGTAMAAWGQVLSEPQIGDVVDYIRQLIPPATRGMTTEQISLEVGRRLYDKECAFCHGIDGRAQTEAAKVLHPPPRNFADPIEMARVGDGRLYSAIKLGRPGTAMASWGELLTPAEIIDLMRYIRGLEQPLPAGMTRAGLDALVGGRIYRRYCIACHGEKGDGQTPLGRVLSPHPPNFTNADATRRLDDRALAQAIVYGRPGTAMASWGGILDSEDTRRVILYIRQTFQRRQ